jgi:hypothetical protein
LDFEEKDILTIGLLTHLLTFIDEIEGLSQKECSCKKDI